MIDAVKDDRFYISYRKGTTQNNPAGPRFRLESARSLGILGDKRAVKALISVLNDEKYYV